VQGPAGQLWDCAEGESCVTVAGARHPGALPDIVAPREPGTGQCALADPRCDIRVDPSCGDWLSCAQCMPPSQ